MRIFHKIFKWLSALAVVGLLALLIASAGIYYYFAPQLPDVETLREVRFQTPLRVYSADRKLIAEFGEKRRTPISYDEIPEDFIHALQAAEDSRFFEHMGIDIKGLFRAAFQLATSGQIQSGGSTITMQVAKNFFLTRERTFSRKFMEILLALRIEQELSKEEILELYINKIYLGHRSYGIQAASTVYYGQPIKDLSLAQLAMIAGLPKAPSAYNPLSNPKRALERRDWILGRMLNLGYIDQTRYQNAITQPVTASYHGSDIELQAPYIAEMVRSELYEQYGDDLYTEGLTVITTIDSRLQESASSALRNGLIAYSERHGYHGPEHQYDTSSMPNEEQLELLDKTATFGGLVPALVTKVGTNTATLLTKEAGDIELSWEGMRWASPYKSVNYAGPEPKKAGDILNVGDLVRIVYTDDAWKLSQIPQVQGAIIALDPNSGGIRALSGGFSFALNKFNRAIQAYRQPGSNIKPFLYTAALEYGFTPASIINDAPVVFHDVSLESNWRPENDNGTFGGPTRLREALYRSRNLVSIRLMRSLGIDKAREFILRFGFSPERLPQNLSLALGSADATPMQVVTGYASFANGGFKIAPYLIDRLESAEGDTLFEAAPLRACPECSYGIAGNSENTGSERPGPVVQQSTTEGAAPRIITPESAFLIYNVMQDVITRGTGRRALELNRSDLAGKTGTTNDQKDAWFSGFNQTLVATAWVGFDQPAPLGRREYGSSAALPIWIDFMRDALKDTPESAPSAPAGVISALIDPATGKLAYPGQSDAIREYFRTDQLPTEHAQSPEEKLAPPTTEQIFGLGG
ncbi:penicillin-binding protein 1A [Marinobacterium zhoushanense]|uniref:Penicillin-binding protein 1A n=1 Tax=Marinobacterium zhoushanense TaxID=1679163 RepID=A0ABQ1KI58_9GAMM|nr:penicillin-binding protein 1A [Marinobacterium zhoushanense]GGB98358.1 penicillin-binding protein 1A [Marinobacterium zhoushanense]